MRGVRGWGLTAGGEKGEIQRTGKVKGQLGLGAHFIGGIKIDREGLLLDNRSSYQSLKLLIHKLRKQITNLQIYQIIWNGKNAN